MFKNKALLFILAAVLLLLVITGIFAGVHANDNKKTFPADGFVLDSTVDIFAEEEVENQFYFSAGSKYANKYGGNIVFKDVNGNKVSLENNKFIHYYDGSLSALGKGVIMEAGGQLNADQVIYYSISDGTVLLRNGTGYSMTTVDSEMTLTDFVWKLSDTTYMVVSPKIDLYLTSESTPITFEDYIQIEYVSEGIVRLVHQNGAYQTISSEAYLTVGDDDVQLFLTGQFFQVNGEKGISLASMVIGADDNVKVQETDDTIKMPTFNVVNGKDGAPGEDGTDGIVGEEGEVGDNGANGNNGSAGGAGAGGTMGNSGEEGEDGSMGKEGDSGEWGYDGKAGEDATNADASGIVAVSQPTPPTVSIKTDTYEVTANGVNMDLAVEDPDSLLYGDLTYTLYDVATGSVITTGNINRGAGSVNINSDSLDENSEYLLAVSGTYSSDGSGDSSSLRDGTFFFKQFATKSLGIDLEKGQTTEKSIMVDVKLEDDSDVSIFSLQYSIDGENWTDMPGAQNINVADLTDNKGTFALTNLQPDSKYSFRFTPNSVYLSDNTVVTPSDKIEVATLKELPYALDSSNNKIYVPQLKPTLVPNQRDNKISVSIPELVDPQKGILKYRYELYETNTAQSLGDPVQTIEFASPQTVAFDAEAGKMYSAKVVVLFDDNEKIIDLETQAADIASLSDKPFPTVTFSEVTHENDKITVTATIHDAQNALLGNVNSDYPLRVTMSSSYGDVFTSEYYVLQDADGTSKSFVITQDGLRSHNLGQAGVDYIISITGPVNTEEVAWSNLSQALKDTMKDTYIGGGKYTTGQQAIVDLVYSDISASRPTEAFALQFNTRKYTQAVANQSSANPLYVDDENTEDDTKYTFGTINKMTFTLYNSHDQELGTTTIVDRTHSDVNHDSEFYAEGYSADGSHLNNNTTDNLVLTPSAFGITSASMSPAETYKVALTSVQDYVGNELAFSKSSTTYDIQIKESHSISPDPTNEIIVREIRNVDAPAGYKDDLLEDDTTVGIRLVPSYGLGDVLEVKYYLYEVQSGQTDPDANDTHALVCRNDVSQYGTLVGTKTFTNFDETKAKEGKSSIASEHYPVIYFNYDTALDDGNYVFERGKTYFFRYEIKTSKDYAASCYGTDIEHQGDPEIYPYCIYKTIANPTYRQEDELLVPFYRSRSYCAQRSKPVVEAYPVSKGDGTITWAYAIYDPDKAIAAASSDGKSYLHWVSYNADTYSASYTGLSLDGSVYMTTDFIEADTDLNGTVYYDKTEKRMTDVQPSSYNTYNIGTNGIGSKECTTYQRSSEIAFNNYTLDKMSNDHYYLMYIPYILKGNEVEYLKSDVYVYDSINNWGSAGIAPSDITVEDNGGGEIKLYVDSNNIKDIAAMKVEIKCGADSVIYDPVMFEIGAGLHNNKQYAVCYLDSSILPAIWQGQSATITVTPYFNTYASSLGELQGNLSGADITIPTANGTLTGNKYAIYHMDDAANNDSYIYTDNSGGLVVRDYVTRSVFTLGASGPYFTAVPNSDGSALNLQYVDGEINKSETKLTAFSQAVHFDENGAYFGSGSSKTHFDVYKLTDGTPAQSGSFTIKEQLPKIRFSSSSVGVKSAALSFEAYGDLGRYPNVFVELYRTFPDNTQHGCDLTGDIHGNKFIYTATERTDATSGADNPVPINISAGGSSGTIDFMITNLEHSTEAEATNYYIRIYRLDGSNNRVYLYDMDYKMPGKQYNFTMANEVDINIVPSPITYTSYLDKKANFDYYINGAGMGFDLKYSIKLGETEVMQGTLPKIGGTGDYAYYGNKPDINTKQPLDLSPSGALKLAGNYTITLTAIDKVDGQAIGTKTENFNVPLWSAPVSRCTVVAGADNIHVTYNMNDVMKTIVNEDNSTTEGKYYITLWNEDESTQVGGPFECSAQADVTFDHLQPNTKYVVKINATVDSNNNHTEPYTDFVDTYTATTQAEVSCKVTGYKNGSNVSLRLYDLSNFGGVTNIKYTIYGPGGNSIGSGDIAPVVVDGAVTVDTDTAAGAAGTYTVNIQFYDENGNLIGNVLNNQFIIN